MCERCGGLGPMRCGAMRCGRCRGRSGLATRRVAWGMGVMQGGSSTGLGNGAWMGWEKLGGGEGADWIEYLVFLILLNDSTPCYAIECLTFGPQDFASGTGLVSSEDSMEVSYFCSELCHEIFLRPGRCSQASFPSIFAPPVIIKLQYQY